jgi:hypothetical protein
MSSNLAVAIRPVLLNALNVVNDVPAPEDANLEKLADRLLEIMFAVPEQTVTVPVVTEDKPKKARKSKTTEPAPEAPAPEAPAPEEKPKKSRAKKAAEAPLPASDAEAEKPKKAKKEKVVGANIEKLTPTQMKLLKPIADELKVEIEKAKFLEFLNGLAADVYTAKTIYDHFRDFVKPAEAEPEERESIVIDFNGKTYYVTPEDKKVWEETEDGVHKFVGHVGMAAFADMKMPEL